MNMNMNMSMNIPFCCTLNAKNTLSIKKIFYHKETTSEHYCSRACGSDPVD